MFSGYFPHRGLGQQDEVDQGTRVGMDETTLAPGVRAMGLVSLDENDLAALVCSDIALCSARVKRPRV